MRQRRSPWGYTVLALILLAAGTGSILIGVGSFLAREAVPSSETTDAGAASPTALEPTPTEPILPPPPTLTRPESRVPAVGTTESNAPPTLALPTSTATPSGPLASARPTLTTTASSPPVRSPTPTVPAKPTLTVPPMGLYTLRQRMGIGTGVVPVAENVAGQLGFGWYLDWAAGLNRFASAEVEYLPMIRLRGGEIEPTGQELLAVIDAYPGAVWLIGNEPDVKWQDNVTPDTYAEIYHDLYSLLKQQDPSCQVAIGGVSQPTPLRLRYLDQILEAYRARYGEPMPVDVWNVHNFILREERDSWGVDIPPGMTEQTGILREIADHDDLAIFRQQIVDFRKWMKEQGHQDKPLIVSEYGILMPADYGFPAQQVEQFMLATFETFRTAKDPALGYPSDGYRLVQRWCWFSLGDRRYPTGNLVEPDSGQLTPLGVAFGEYVHMSP